MADNGFGLRKEQPGNSRRWPVSTYRLQFNHLFKFGDAAKIVGYLHDLGISDCYASPYFKARPGSLHGYDIIDHNSLNPEIGSWTDFTRFVRELKQHNMGQIVDFVPNHMGIFENAFWQDVLESGPSSIYARFFDINWEPATPELRQKVLLPILEDWYGKVLESGLIKITFKQGAFFICYRNYELPIDPKTVVAILDRPCYCAELQNILAACRNLPERSETHPESMAERRQGIEKIKKGLLELYGQEQAVRAAVDDGIRRLNGSPGNAPSFTGLHSLLEEQAYRLSYWNAASDEINYRRFFNVSDLAGIRVEDPQVFNEIHRLLRMLLQEGMVTGIRVDHVDGLFNVPEYLRRLQESRRSDMEKAEKGKARPSGARVLSSDPDPVRPLYVVIEKILVGSEIVREAWPVDGTTGYEFGTLLTQIFIERRNARALLGIYRRFTRMDLTFPEVVYRCKKMVMANLMHAELSLLANQLYLICQRTWLYRDFTRNKLREAIGEVIACFPVYRTYIDAYQNSWDEADKTVVNTAVDRAKERNPDISPAIFDFIKNILLLHFIDASEEGRNEQRLFVMRFQQFTGAVMAKGMEDTAFYRYNPLISLNEVGGYPEWAGITTKDFHQQNIRRRRNMPRSLISTSTHDSKRGEDVRARINVLSEIPGEWRSALSRWSRLNRSKKTKVNGTLAPDRNEEYLIYQTLLGTYPTGKVDEQQSADYTERIRGYVIKALREARQYTSWADPNEAYEQATLEFVTGILEPSPSNAFLSDFAALNRLVTFCGKFNSLSQVLLKIFLRECPISTRGMSYGRLAWWTRITVDLWISACVSSC